MSEGAAGRRIAAARVCRRISGVFERVARGDLHLCALCAVAPHLTTENATELLEACCGKTRRQVEELLAVRFPRPDVRAQIRRLPTRAPGALAEQVAPARVSDSTLVLTGSQIPALSPNSPVVSASPVSSPVNPVSSPARTAMPDARRRAREIEALSADRFGVHFTADAELRELIERARQLASHRLPNGDLASLMKLMAQTFVRQEEKRRFGLGARARSNGSRNKEAANETWSQANTSTTTEISMTVAPERTPSQRSRVTPPGGVAAPSGATAPSGVAAPNGATAPSGVAAPNGVAAPSGAMTATGAPGLTRALAGRDVATPQRERTRYLSADARRETCERDRGRCAFVSANGRRCQERAFLEIDHIVPFARHGASDASNLRLLCKAHNRLHARHCFGVLHLAKKSAAKRRAQRALELAKGDHRKRAGRSASSDR